MNTKYISYLLIKIQYENNSYKRLQLFKLVKFNLKN
jgi:hypothetical protein